MSTFFVNGKSVTTTRKQSLLRFLRDELKLTSVKDGCSQGACGACTVIIDGETCRACVPTTDTLEGRNIITVEGLTDWESKVYTYAYGEAGAVQCGFCIPGMVMCTKALLDKNPDPTEAEIRYAIRNNYCRCTGYVKIIAAIRLAAKIKREGIIPEDSATDWKIGSRVHRLDVEEKVLGYGKYPDDFYFDNMCYGSAVRSKYPRARVLSIDISAAKALPGVVAVLTAEDVPGENLVGHLKHDQYTLIPVGGLTHYLGDAIALVVAEDRETLEKAKKLVKADYTASSWASFETELAEAEDELKTPHTQATVNEAIAHLQNAIKDLVKVQKETETKTPETKTDINNDKNNQTQTAYKAKVKLNSVKNTKGRKAVLKWKKVKNADGYVVYRATKKNGKYAAVKTINKGKTVTFTNKKLKKGKTYYYKIKAYKKVNGKKALGQFSAVKSVKIKK